MREEIDSIFGDDKDRPITSDDIAKMKYLDLVIKENLRVYPSVPFIQRHLTSDLKLGIEIKLVSYTYKIKMSLISDLINELCPILTRYKICC